MYLIISENIKSVKSYVGYTNNLKKRIALHNQEKGAKSTRGRIWKLVFKKSFRRQSIAMKYE